VDADCRLSGNPPIRKSASAALRVRGNAAALTRRHH